MASATSVVSPPARATAVRLVPAGLEWASVPGEDAALVETRSRERAALRAWRLNDEGYTPSEPTPDWPTGLVEEGAWEELAVHLHHARLRRWQDLPPQSNSVDLAVEELLQEWEEFDG